MLEKHGSKADEIQTLLSLLVKDAQKEEMIERSRVKNGAKECYFKGKVDGLALAMRVVYQVIGGVHRNEG